MRKAPKHLAKEEVESWLEGYDRGSDDMLDVCQRQEAIVRKAAAQLLRIWREVVKNPGAYEPDYLMGVKRAMNVFRALCWMYL